MMVPPTHQVGITLQGQRQQLAYIKWPGKSSPSWVFVHGMGSSRLAFVDLLERAQLPGPAYAVDMPGFGASCFPPKRQTLEDLVSALHAFMEALAIRDSVVVGHSLGGMVAGELAIRFPHLVRGVVLVASAGIIPPQNILRPSPVIWFNRFLIWVTSFDWYGDKMLRALGLDPRKVSPKTRARMRYGWRRAKEMARMQEFYNAPLFVDRLSSSQAWSTIIHGDRDPLFPLEAITTAVAGRLPIWVQKGAGHLPYDYDVNAFWHIFRQAIEKSDSSIRL